MTRHFELPAVAGAVDPSDMLGRISEFPRQIRDAWKLIQQPETPLPDSQGIRSVLVLGMGGSAIGGDLVAGLVAGQCRVPVSVHRDYGLPGWVDEHTLVVASSYSGGTEETLSGWDEAGRRGARRVAMTTGGELAERAQGQGEPLIRFDYKAQPRAALGYGFTLLLGLLARLGLVPDTGLEKAVEALENADFLQSDPEEPGRPAELANWLKGGIPVILASAHLGAVARRWTTQINENSKAWAFWNEYPELNHNVVVGLENPESLRRATEGRDPGLLRVIHLESAEYHPQTRKRMEITRELMERAGFEVRTLRAEPAPGPLAEMLNLIWLGDLVSYRLAAAYATDPTPVDVITELKNRLKD